MTRQLSLRSLGWFLASLAFTIALLLVWEVIAQRGFVPRAFLPSPSLAFQNLWSGLADGTLVHKTGLTLERMFYGWLVASLVGLVLGTLIGISPVARDYIAPTLELFRPLPVSAIIPVAIAFLGLSQGMILTVIGFGALWPVLLATVHGYSVIEPRLIEVGRSLQMSKWEVIYKIGLPSIIPDVIAAMRISITIALILAVVCEMLTGYDGLGHQILNAARAFRSAEMFAVIFILSVVGYLTATALDLVENWVCRYR